MARLNEHLTPAGGKPGLVRFNSSSRTAPEGGTAYLKQETHHQLSTTKYKEQSTSVLLYLSGQTGTSKWLLFFPPFLCSSCRDLLVHAPPCFQGQGTWKGHLGFSRLLLYPSCGTFPPHHLLGFPQGAFSVGTKALVEPTFGQALSAHG